MYSERTLTADQTLYISRVQQKIAEIAASIAAEMVINDVTYRDAQISVELQYTIDVLRNTVLDASEWSEDDIQEMMDFYSLRAKLTEFVFKEIDFDFVNSNACPTCVSQSQLDAVNQASIARDAQLSTDLTDEIGRVEQESIDRDDALDLRIDNFIPGISKELQVPEDRGGIRAPRTFTIGTPLEDIWEEFLGLLPEVYSLNYDGRVSPVEVGTAFTITRFYWTAKGTPANLLLSDTEGVLANQIVSGTEFNTSKSYNLNTQRSITWTLTGDNVVQTTVTTYSVYRSYAGKNITGNVPTEAEILASVNTSLVSTSTSITFSLNTSASEFGWIAVEKTQSVNTYTKWYVDELNNANIGSGEFILSPVDVTVNGRVYSVYVYGYASPLSEPLKLHR